jgi:hypothetical protein
LPRRIKQPHEPARPHLTPARGPSRSDFAWGAALVAITLIAYLPALGNGFIWDDNDYVTQNLVLRSLDGLRRLWFEPQSVPQYYPVAFTGFWFEYHLWGLHPFGYHVVNILLHATSAGLLWRVLRRLDISSAWMAAALFAVHPMQVESVAWVTERKNVLSGLFFFAAFLTYLNAETPDGAGGIRWRPYVGALALFVGALLSKSVTCSLPAVLLLVFWWQRGTLDRRTVLRLIPMFVVGLIMAATTVWLEGHHVGAAGPEFSLSPLERMLVAGRALWFYPLTLLWPHGLTFMYPRWTIDTHVWWQYLFPVAAAAVITALFIGRQRVGRGPLVGALCYAGSLTPALGFINVYPMRYSFVADHFQYLASAALLTLLAALGTVLVRRVVRAPSVATGLGVLVCALLAVLTLRQSRVYASPESLWRDTIVKNPAAWMAMNNLAYELEQQGRAREAVPYVREAIRLNPNCLECYGNLADAYRAYGDEASAKRVFADLTAYLLQQQAGGGGKQEGPAEAIDEPATDADEEPAAAR